MIYLMIVLVILTRFIPHMPDFSPVYGTLLFAGARLRKRDSIWFPVLLLAASDLVLTRFFYHSRIGWEQPTQIAAFAAIAMIGWMLRKRFTVGRLGLACLAAPTAFYLISDFGSWLENYPRTWQGLIACYVAAIPFQGRIFASTAVFAGILFGLQHLYAARAHRERHSHAIVR